MNGFSPEWNKDRLKDVTAINSASLPANTDPDYEFNYLEISNVDYYGVVDHAAIKRLCYEDAPSRARRVVGRNSTVISSVRPNLQAVAFFPDDQQNFVCSTGYNVVQSHENKLLPKFTYYALISEASRQYFEATAKGVGYPAIDDKDFNSCPIPLPPLPEQERIVAYLDASCSAIDVAVAAKRRQLKTLDSLSKTIINHALTCGCNEKTDFIKADCSWFPFIPSGWRVLRLKSMFRIIYRYPTYFNIEYVPEGVPEVRGEALNPDGFIERLMDERYISQETNALFPMTQLEIGDVVMSVRGTMGKIGYVDERYAGANITANLLRLSPDKSVVTGEFLRWLMRSTYFNEALISSAPQTTIKTITMPQLAKIRIALPPKNEQQELCYFLEKKITEIKRMVAVIERQIETLLAYRKSLIHECVTGRRRISEAELNKVKARG